MLKRRIKIHKWISALWCLCLFIKFAICIDSLRNSFQNGKIEVVYAKESYIGNSSEKIEIVVLKY